MSTNAVAQRLRAADSLANLRSLDSTGEVPRDLRTQYLAYALLCEMLRGEDAALDAVTSIAERGADLTKVMVMSRSVDMHNDDLLVAPTEQLLATAMRFKYTKLANFIATHQSEKRRTTEEREAVKRREAGTVPLEGDGRLSLARRFKLSAAGAGVFNHQGAAVAEAFAITTETNLSSVQPTAAAALVRMLVTQAGDAGLAAAEELVENGLTAPPADRASKTDIAKTLGALALMRGDIRYFNLLKTWAPLEGWFDRVEDTRTTSTANAGVTPPDERVGNLAIRDVYADLLSAQGQPVETAVEEFDAVVQEIVRQGAADLPGAGVKELVVKQTGGRMREPIASKRCAPRP